MGYWSSGLYGNDTTSDVKDIYNKYLENQLGDEEAYQKVLQQFDEMMGTDEECLFWYALADQMWRLGRLVPEVKEKAIEWLDKNGGLDAWTESDSNGAGWKKTMAALRKRLDSPMPKRKTVRKFVPPNHDIWNLNDVYAFQLCGKAAKDTSFYGKYAIIQKIGDRIDPYYRTPTMLIQIFDGIFDDKPTLDDIDGLRLLPIDDPNRPNIAHDYTNKGWFCEKEPIYMNAIICFARSTRELPKKALTFLGNKEGPTNRQMINTSMMWWQLEDKIIQYHDFWKNLTYQTKQDGTFDFDPVAQTSPIPPSPLYP